jgi:cytidyltransferase-like protein
MLVVMVASLLIGVLDLVCPCSAAAALAFPVVFIPVVFASFYANALDVFGKITPMSGLTAGPLGLFGGTFDPIHYGHLRLAETAREALGLARVRLIPAGQPPHRATPGASGAHRLAMARLAAADNPAFEVDPAEVEAAQASFTILTLERLRAELGPPGRWCCCWAWTPSSACPPGGAGPSSSTSPTWPSPTAPATASTRRRCPPRWPTSSPAARPRPPWAQPRPAPGAVRDDAAGHLRHRHPRPRAAGQSLRYLLPAGC